jgi:hypothetical protein
MGAKQDRYLHGSCRAQKRMPIVGFAPTIRATEDSSRLRGAAIVICMLVVANIVTFLHVSVLLLPSAAYREYEPR